MTVDLNLILSFQGTPGSQASFGENPAPEGLDETSQDKAPLQDETANLPPYLPSIYGCRSVEVFEVR